MTREEFIKNKIKESGYNLKEFANSIDMPYTTLLFILNDIGRTSVDNIITICKALNITIDELQNNTENNIILTLEEKEIIKRYRELPEMRNAIKRILGVEEIEK